MIVIVGGPVAVGKTTITTSLHELWSTSLSKRVVRLIRSDLLRKQAIGIASTDQLPERYYCAAYHEVIYRVMHELASTVATIGDPIIIDASYTMKWQRNLLRDLKTKVGVIKIFLDAPLVERVARLRSRFDDASDADAQYLTEQIVEMPMGNDWQLLATSNSGPAQLVENILHQIVADARSS